MAYAFRRPNPLRLELLGERALPSVTCVDNGAGTVVVYGDQQANEIDITDNGAGGVTVTTADGPQEFDGTVTKVVVWAAAGEDVVTYTLADGLTDAVTRTVVVCLGNFNDTFTADLGDLPAGSDLTLKVYGGNGFDNLSVTGGAVAGKLTVGLYGGNAGDTLSADFAGDVSGEFFLTLLGGNGRDALSATVAGALTGTVDWTLNGGNGWDTVGAALSVDALADGSTAAPQVTVHVYGGNAKDDLSLTVDGDGASSLTGAVLEINGGYGWDNFVAHTDGLVTVRDPEFKA